MKIDDLDGYIKPEYVGPRTIEAIFGISLSKLMVIQREVPYFPKPVVRQARFTRWKFDDIKKFFDRYYQESQSVSIPSRVKSPPSETEDNYTKNT